MNTPKSAVAASPVPENMRLVPAWKGYALLGTGMYSLNHSAAPADPELGAEFFITLATDEQKSGNRQIGERRANDVRHDPVQPEEMVLRIGFLTPQALYALEDQLRLLRAEHFPASASPVEPVAPLRMILHCPKCRTQHIDAPEACSVTSIELWDNPPHRSHLCHGCGHIWRPADVPTTGVAAIKTTGANDSPIAPGLTIGQPAPAVQEPVDNDGGPLREGWQISIGPGHAGYGAYAHMDEYVEEGSVCLATFDPHEYPGARVAPAVQPCPQGDDKPEPTCTNRHQCWEPCGELGNSAEHVRVGRESESMMKRMAHTPAPSAAPAEPEPEGTPQGRQDELLNIARMIEGLERECSIDDPESAIAIQNSRYMNLAAKVRRFAALPAAPSEVAALMMMTEPQIDAELQSLDMNPDDAANQGRSAVDRAIAQAAPSAAPADKRTDLEWQRLPEIRAKFLRYAKEPNDAHALGIIRACDERLPAAPGATPDKGMK